MRYVPAKEKKAWHQKAMAASEKGDLSSQIELWLRKKRSTGSYRACARLRMRSWKILATTGPSLWRESWSALILIFQPECTVRSACGSSMPVRANITTQRSTISSIPRNATPKPVSMPTGRRWLPMCAIGTFVRRGLWPDSRISSPAHPRMSSRPFWNAQKQVGQENRRTDEGNIWIVHFLDELL